MFNVPWFPLILLSSDNIRYLLIFWFFLIHQFVCGSKKADIDGFTHGGDVLHNVRICTLEGCTNSSTLWDGIGGLVIYGGTRFLFWLYGDIEGNGDIFKEWWAGLLWKIWAIWLVTFLLHHNLTIKKVSSGGVSWFSIMSPISCWRKSYIVVFWKAMPLGSFVMY